MLLLLLAGYMAASVVLLLYPGLLHKRRTQDFRVSHGSHRGGAGENVENTITAYDHAHGNLALLLRVTVH